MKSFVNLMVAMAMATANQKTIKKKTSNISKNWLHGFMEQIFKIICVISCSSDIPYGVKIVTLKQVAQIRHSEIKNVLLKIRYL